MKEIVEKRPSCHQALNGWIKEACVAKVFDPQSDIPNPFHSCPQQVIYLWFDDGVKWILSCRVNNHIFKFSRSEYLPSTALTSCRWTIGVLASTLWPLVFLLFLRLSWNYLLFDSKSLLNFLIFLLMKNTRIYFRCYLSQILWSLLAFCLLSSLCGSWPLELLVNIANTEYHRLLNDHLLRSF